MLTSDPVTLHLFYFIIAMLSSRSKSISDAHYSKPSYVRQSLAAMQTVTLMCGDSKPDLHPLPLVPYGISLALSVAYKHMRRSQLPHQQEQANLDFKRCCKTLETFKRAWWSADIMATLAHKVLGEIEKASDPATLPRNTENLTSNGTRGQSGRTRPDQMHPTRSGAITEAQPATNVTASSLPDLTPAGGEATANETTNFESVELEVQPNLENIDNIFGAYLNPHFPVNYDDLLDMGEFGWDGNSWS